MADNYWLSFDSNRAYMEIMQAIENELSKIGDRFVAIAKHEVMNTTDNGAPGRKAWRRHMANNIRKFPMREENGMLILPVGLELNKGTSEWIRALVITYGSGYKAETDGGTGMPIHARPMETVWDSELSGEHISNAWTPFFLPDEFNQIGNMWLENTMRRIQPELDNLQARVPDIIADIVMRNIN